MNTWSVSTSFIIVRNNYQQQCTILSQHFQFLSQHPLVLHALLLRQLTLLHTTTTPPSLPQSADDSNPINFSQPMSAPHNQLRYPADQKNPSSSFYPTPDSAINLHRMSGPTLISGSHPSAYHPIDSRYNYAPSSTYSPPSLRYPVSSRPPCGSLQDRQQRLLCRLPFTTDPQRWLLQSLKPQPSPLHRIHRSR